MKNKNLTINGLRGFSALIVVLAHIYGMAVAGGFFTDLGSSSLGTFGVCIFFMISGFLIVQSLNKHSNLGVFLKNRVLRIYPVFLFLHISIFLAGPVIGYEWLKGIEVRSYVINFFSNLFFLPGIFDMPIAQKNAWSLSYEFLFYLIAGFTFLLLRSKLNNAMRITLLVLVVAAAAVTMFFHSLSLFFVVGTAVFYLLHKNKPISPLNHSAYSGILYLVLFFVTYNINALLSLIPAFLFFMSVVREEGVVSRILKTKPFQYLGNISYSLYLWHPFAFYPLKVVFSRLHFGNEYLMLIAFGVMGVTFALIAAHYSYKIIEVKFTKSILRERRTKQVAPKLTA